MNVGEACTRDVYIVRPHEPLLQAIYEMCKRNVGCVIASSDATSESFPSASSRTAISSACSGERPGCSRPLLGIVGEQLSSLALLVERQSRRH